MSSARWRRVAAMKGRAARRRLRHPAKTEWRVASEVGVASGQWSVASESGGSGERQVAPGGCGEGEPECSEPTQERCLATEKAPNKAIWNHIKSCNRKDLSQKQPGRRGGNKAKVPRGRRGASRRRAMADRLGRVTGGR